VQTDCVVLGPEQTVALACESRQSLVGDDVAQRLFDPVREIELVVAILVDDDIDEPSRP
jgi:hypothetical protein